MGRSRESEPFAARQLGDLRGVPTFLPALGEDWRVAPEGERIIARRCSCEVPVLDHEPDGEARCIRCGRTPSVRLSAASEGPSPAMDGAWRGRLLRGGMAPSPRVALVETALAVRAATRE